LLDYQNNYVGNSGMMSCMLQKVLTF